MENVPGTTRLASVICYNEILLAGTALVAAFIDRWLSLMPRLGFGARVM